MGGEEHATTLAINEKKTDLLARNFATRENMGELSPDARSHATAAGNSLLELCLKAFVGAQDMR